MKKNVSSGFVLLTICIVLFLDSCAIHPVAWQPGKVSLFAGTTKLNEKLTKASKISLSGWFGPEDILFDSIEISIVVSIIKVLVMVEFYK